MEGIEDKVLLDILSRAVGPESARIAFDALSLPPSVSIRYNPYKFRSDQKGLCDELFAEAAGLASPDRGRPRHARGRGPDRRRGGENQFSQTLREMGGAERSEESGLAEPALDAIATVSITVSNEGPYDGMEVVQLYVRDEYASVTRPVKELKAFKRVSLKAGESAEVTFAITPEMLQCYGADNRWSVEPGDFTILVGSSSDDKDLQTVTLKVK